MTNIGSWRFWVIIALALTTLACAGRSLTRGSSLVVAAGVVAALRPTGTPGARTLAAARSVAQPRPTKGISVAMTVSDKTLASGGRPAM